VVDESNEIPCADEESCNEAEDAVEETPAVHIGVEGIALRGWDEDE
jgi:hypothetical protein